MLASTQLKGTPRKHDPGQIEAATHGPRPTLLRLLSPVSNTLQSTHLSELTRCCLHSFLHLVKVILQTQTLLICEALGNEQQHTTRAVRRRADSLVQPRALRSSKSPRRSRDRSPPKLWWRSSRQAQFRGVPLKKSRFNGQASLATIASDIIECGERQI